MAGPVQRDEHGKTDDSARSTPRGEFLSADFETDCARFIAESKERARRRAEATSRELGLPRPRP